MQGLKFGIHLTVLPVKDLVKAGVLADKSGFDSIWVPDHYTDLPPSGDKVDPWVILTAIGVQSSHVMLSTDVTDVLRCHPTGDEKMVTAEEVLKKDKEYSPVTLVEGRRAIVKDIERKEIIDCLSQTAGVLGVGHTHPRVVKAVKEQVEKISHALTMFVNVPRAELAEKLAGIAPGNLKNK